MTLMHANAERPSPKPEERPRLALVGLLGLLVACLALGSTLGTLTGPDAPQAQLQGVTVSLPEGALPAQEQGSEIANMAGYLEAVVSPREPSVEYVLPASDVLMTLAVSGVIGFRLHELARGYRLVLTGHPEMLRLGVDQRYLAVRVLGYLIFAGGRNQLTAYIVPVDDAVVTLVCVRTTPVSGTPSPLCSHLVGGLHLEPPLETSVAVSTLAAYQSSLARLLNGYAAKRDALRARLARTGARSSAAKLAGDLASASERTARAVKVLAPISLTDISRSSVERSLEKLSGDYRALAHAIRAREGSGLRASERAIEEDDDRLAGAIGPALEPLQAWAAQVSGIR
jgi:hypothetical protein